jgi:serine-type D-Ala-D-Ala carboxypeptidase (penicillin-binding protein 5/6)
LYFFRLIAAAGLLALVPAGPAADLARAPNIAPSVEAVPVALLVDLSAGQTLYAHNADKAFLPASMTKAMSALVAFDLIATGRLDPDQQIVVNPDLAGQWAGKGTTLSLRPGEKVRIADLLEGMITVSANDAAEVLAERAAGSRAAWIALMNQRAKALGMSGSRFSSPSGWPDGGQTRVTARDMVRLARALLENHPELYRRYFGHAAMNWRGQSLASRNPFAGRVAGADGIKTGHTREAGYSFLGSAERDGRRLVLVIGGANSEANRAAAAQALLEWGYANWESRHLLAANQLIGTAQVQDGEDREVGLAPLKAGRIAVPRGTAPKVSARIVYHGPLLAPLVKGQVVAGLEVTIAGQLPHDIPLAAQQAVNRAGPFDRVANGLLGLLP